MWFGWAKAVHKMGLDQSSGKSAYVGPVTKVGQLLAALVTVGFMACVLAARAAAARAA